MENFVCKNPVCDGLGQHCAKGLCHACYMSKQQSVARGRDTWESSRYRQPGKLGRPRHKPALTYLLCDAEDCPQEAWRGRRKRDDGKEWEVRWFYAEDKQYCSNHRPKFDTVAPPREVFTKEWTD